MSAPHARIPVAVLGATGAVGQTFLRLLADHPWFEVAELAASERSAGKSYGEAARWLEGQMPETLAARRVLACDPSNVCAPIVFSALDSSAAGEAEQAFARAGRTVFSNAKNHRMDDDVPLVIPEVNADHLGILPLQRQNRGWTGAIVTNGNCAAIIATLALAPLHERFGVRQIVLTTMQAVSGAGYPGVPSLDILGNVIPFISDEEPKLEREIPKMLGRFRDGGVTHASMAVSAQVNRVPVEHGHMVSLAISCETQPTAADATRALSEWVGDARVRGLPSAPDRPVAVAAEELRPQPRRDVWTGAGMTVVVGRVRNDDVMGLRLVAMGHNTVRGAAGASILNAELMVAAGQVPGT